MGVRLPRVRRCDPGVGVNVLTACPRRRGPRSHGTFTSVRADGRTTDDPAAPAPGPWPEDLEEWRKSSGLAIAEEAIEKRRTPWVKAEDLAAYLALDIIADSKGREREELLDDFDAHARRRCGTVLADLARDLPRKSRAKAARGEQSFGDIDDAPMPRVQVEAFDSAIPTTAILREDYDAWDAARTAARPIAVPGRPARSPGTTSEGDDEIEGRADVDEMRRAVAAWLPTAPWVGHRDARFGDPFLQASALLHLLTFFNHPLLDHRRWPHGFPPPQDRTVDADALHMRAALWLADRDWFPAEPADDAERRRARRGRDAVQALARRLRDREGVEEQ